MLTLTNNNIKIFLSVCGILILVCIIIGIINYSYSKNLNLNTIEKFDVVSDNYTTYLEVMNDLNKLTTNISTVNNAASQFLTNNPIYNPNFSMTNASMTQSYIDSLSPNDSDAQFYVDQIIKEKQLEIIRQGIQNNLALIPSPSSVPGMPGNDIFGSIKNPQTGTNLNIEKIDPRTSTSNDNKYAVYLNGKCLSYDVPNDPKTRYTLQDCRKDDTKQQFNLNNIKTINEYNNIIPNGISSYKMINNGSSSSINSFYVVNPIKNNEIGDRECLGIKNGNITIEPCNLTTYQRFNANARNLKC
jgi:hypothetical protein